MKPKALLLIIRIDDTKFKNPNFIRDQPELMVKICRKKSKKRKQSVTNAPVETMGDSGASDSGRLPPSSMHYLLVATIFYYSLPLGIVDIYINLPPIYY